MQSLTGMGLLGVTGQPAATTAPRSRLSLREALAISGTTKQPTRRPTPAPAPRTRQGGKRSKANGVQRITRAQQRAHNNGTRPLADGNYFVIDERGQQCGQVDIGMAACKRGLTAVMLHKVESPEKAKGR